MDKKTASSRAIISWYLVLARLALLGLLRQPNQLGETVLRVLRWSDRLVLLWMALRRHERVLLRQAKEILPHLGVIVVTFRVAATNHVRDGSFGAFICHGLTEGRQETRTVTWDIHLVVIVGVAICHLLSV